MHIGREPQPDLGREASHQSCYAGSPVWRLLVATAAVAAAAIALVVLARFGWSPNLAVATAMTNAGP